MKSLLSLAVGIMLVVASGLTAAHAQDKANAALDKKVTLDLVTISLKQVAEYLTKSHKVDFVLGPGVNGKTPITANYKATKLRDALDDMLGRLKLGYKVKGDQIVIEPLASK